MVDISYLVNTHRHRVKIQNAWGCVLALPLGGEGHTHVKCVFSDIRGSGGPYTVFVYQLLHAGMNLDLEHFFTLAADSVTRGHY